MKRRDLESVTIFVGRAVELFAAEAFDRSRPRDARGTDDVDAAAGLEEALRGAALVLRAARACRLRHMRDEFDRMNPSQMEERAKAADRLGSRCRRWLETLRRRGWRPAEKDGEACAGSGTRATTT